MKKVFLTLACAVIALSVSAQRTGSSSSSFFSTMKSDQPITFSVRAGINFANMTLEAGKVSYSPDTYTGFHVGVAVDFPLLESFYIQSGLYYTVKGAKVEDFKEELTANPSYLEIPILASYRYNFSEAAQLQVNFGPYLAYGIGGKIKYEYERTSVEEDVFGDDAAKRFDAGLQIGAGVTIAQHYYVGCGYQFGLTDIGRDGIEVKNKNFFISLGYQF